MDWSRNLINKIRYYQNKLLSLQHEEVFNIPIRIPRCLESLYAIIQLSE